MQRLVPGERLDRREVLAGGTQTAALPFRQSAPNSEMFAHPGQAARFADRTSRAYVFRRRGHVAFAAPREEQIDVHAETCRVFAPFVVRVVDGSGGGVFDAGTGHMRIMAAQPK